MKKITGLALLLALACCVPVIAFNEDKFRATLEKLQRVLIPSVEDLAANDAVAGKKGQGPAAVDDEFVWLRAEKVNKQIDVMIRGIETAKGVATALAVIVNLYESDKISVDVACSAIQILKLRAVFLKVFVTNGDTELEVMIQILNEHEADFGEKAKSSNASKTRIGIETSGKIKNPPTAP